jgi:hypothetical protein
MQQTLRGLDFLHKNWVLHRLVRKTQKRERQRGREGGREGGVCIYYIIREGGREMYVYIT